MEGGKNGGPLRSFGWQKDRERGNERESAHIRREVPRIHAGVSPLTPGTNGMSAGYAQ